ncbi:unnamed protein product [Diamesa tonsa]
MSNNVLSESELAIVQKEHKIATFIGDVIKDFNEKDSKIHDVAIVRLGTKTLTDLYHELMRTIPKENPILFPRLDEVVNRRRKVSFMIIFIDTYDAVELLELFKLCNNPMYIDRRVKFIIIPNKMILTNDELFQISLFHVLLGIFNTIIITQQNEHLMVYSFNPFFEKEVYTLKDATSDIEILFPDKLKNLYGYSYSVIIFEQHPRISIQNNKLQGVDVNFLEIVCHHQNATFNFTNILNLNDTKIDQKHFYQLLSRNQVHLTLNTAFTTGDTSAEYINTFDVNGFCALVPKPPGLSYMYYILTPFDSLTWIMFIVSIVTCAIIWRIFNLMRNGNQNSAGYFVFSIIAHFFSQSIPFRNNRTMQKIILQVCIFMTFILSNAFQSTIISLVSVPRNGTMYNSFNEMFNANDLHYLVDSIFFKTFQSSIENKSFVKKMKVIDKRLSQMNFQQKASENTAFILRCDLVDYLIYAKKDHFNQNIDDFYYLLPDQINSFYESFLTSFLSPYYNKFQTYNTKVFESGIRQYWKRLNKTTNSQIDSHIDSGFMSSQNQENLIKLKDLRGVCILLAIGLLTSGFILIIEIFWKDCQRKLRLWMNLRLFKRYNKQRRMKARRNRVAPMSMITEEV